MRISALLAPSAAIPLLSADLATASPSPLFAQNSKGYLALDLEPTLVPAEVAASHLRLRRQHDLLAPAAAPPGVDMVDITVAYAASLAVGNPPQPVRVIIDTGSSWLWVNPSCEWARTQRLCLTAPRYDPAASKPTPARVPGLDGIWGYASGDWAAMLGYSDTFWLDDKTSIPGQAFGLANETDGAFLGFLGLGPDIQSGFNSAAANYSVLNSMVAQGLIASRAFSLALESVLPSFQTALGSGAPLPKSLIFGGVDKNKFKGKFLSLPVQEPGKGGGDDAWRFWVQLSGFGHTAANKTASSKSPYNFSGHNATYIMDTATTGIYLPREVVAPVMAEMGLGGVWRPGGFPDIACRRATEKGSLQFTFGGADGNVTVSVPYSALVLESTPGSCVFLLTSVESNAVDLHILGLGLLRATYTVFDWDNKAVLIAERAQCGQSSDVIPIPAGVSGLSAIEGNCK